MGAISASAANRLRLPNFPALAESINFFEQSIRRDPNSSQEFAMSPKMQTVSRPGTCGATFLENRAGRFIVLSALHCLSSGNLEEACRRRDLQITTIEAETANCSRIILSDPNSDVLVFEVQFARPPANLRTAQLSVRPPALGTRLVVPGYPGDTRRDTRPTVTENCWVKGMPVPINPSPRNNPTAEVMRILNADSHEWIPHNCSNFSGNSGGGFFIEGTREMVGITSLSVVPSHYNFLSPDEQPDYLLFLRRYVQRNRAVFDREGITILDGPAAVPPAPPANPYAYLENAIGKTYLLNTQGSNWCSISIKEWNRETQELHVELRSRVPTRRESYPIFCNENLSLKCWPAPNRACADVESSLSILEFSGETLHIVSRLDSPARQNRLVARLVDPSSLARETYENLIALRSRTRVAQELIDFTLAAAEVAGSAAEFMRAFDSIEPNLSPGERGIVRRAIFERRTKFLALNPSVAAVQAFRGHLPGIGEELIFLDAAIQRAATAREFLNLSSIPANSGDERRYLLRLFRGQNFRRFIELFPSPDEYREFRENSASLSEESFIGNFREALLATNSVAEFDRLVALRRAEPSRELSSALQRLAMELRSHRARLVLLAHDSRRALAEAEILRERLSRFNENLRRACRLLGLAPR